MKRFQDHNVWIKISLFLLLITSFLGLLIRFLPLQSFIPNSYFYGLLQSHSHTGFLGWIFLLLYVLLLYKFGSDNILKRKKTIIILLVNSFLITAIAISFPFDNYGSFSITFLSAFLLFSYYTLIYFYKNITNTYDNFISIGYVKTGIVFYFISSIAPWLLAPIIILGYKKSPLYYNDIFLYLHFLYNGFITFSIIGLFYLDIELKNLKSYDFSKYLKLSLYLLGFGTLLNYSQSLLWNNPNIIVYIIAFISSILMICGIFFLIKITRLKDIEYSGISNQLLYLSVGALMLKTGLQFFQSFPYFANLSYMFKGQFIIGYIHLVTLGFVTSFIIAYSLKVKFILSNVIIKFAIYSFVFGVIFTEVLLFGQGILLWNGNTSFVVNFNLYIFVSSLFLFIGFLFLFIGVFYKKKIGSPA